MLSGFASLKALDGISIPRDENKQDEGYDATETMGVRILVDDAEELIDEALELFRGRSPSRS